MTCRCLAISGPTAMATTMAITPMDRWVTNAPVQQHRLRSMFMAARTLTLMAMQTPLMDARTTRAVLGLGALVASITIKTGGLTTTHPILAAMPSFSTGSNRRILTAMAMVTTPVQIVAQPLLIRTIHSAIYSRSTPHNTLISMAMVGAITTATL